jgi:hypothetical protein
MNKTSERMLNAIALIRLGWKVPEAARVCAISHSAIYMSPLYERICKERIERGEKVRRAAHRTRP